MPTLRDCMYGQAIGDALGVPYEFRPRDTFECDGMVGYGTHNQPAGTWSDDTSMTLAICDSYRELRRIDVDDIRRRFLAWFKDDEYTCGGLFDIGNATARALSFGFGLRDERDNGNGSLMRTVPLAFFDSTDTEIRAVSAITHAHETSTESCVRLVHVARALIDGASIDRAVAIGGVDAQKRRDEIESGGYVLHTYEAALWCLANTTSYTDCVLTAVNLGSDTDTTAAVAGALAGIVYGVEGIPSDWLSMLKGKPVIDSCLP